MSTFESYQQWIKKHNQKQQQIIDKLKKQNYTLEEIVDYFDYDNLYIKEKDYCPLFTQNKKCHQIKDLNCYFCGCPYIKITQNKSYCLCNSKFATYITKKDYTHLNCSSCVIPHKKSFVVKYLSSQESKN